MRHSDNSIICITSCNRLEEIKKYIFSYINFCNNNEGFSFLLSLDGCDRNYIDFCNKFKIPLLYSENREGVGLSKNRVLDKFPNFDYYYFIEDDMELLEPSIFCECIKFYKIQQVPHLSYTAFGELTTCENKNGWQVLQGFKSGAQFSFFEAKALFKVGGWNTLFAKYKRYGHSEHSFRFFNNGLQNYPFIALSLAADSFIMHDPPHVTVIENESIFDHYHPEEKQLIESKTMFFPITTLSSFYFNGFDMNYNIIVAEFLQKNKKRYPLSLCKDRRNALAEYYFEFFKRKTNFIQKLLFLFLSTINKPLCAPMKHYIKTKLKMI